MLMFGKYLESSVLTVVKIQDYQVDRVSLRREEILSFTAPSSLPNLANPLYPCSLLLLLPLLLFLLSVESNPANLTL